MGTTEVLATLVTPDIRYIGVLQGELKKEIKDVSDITYKHITLTDSSNKKKHPLEEIVSFQFHGIERDPNKYADYIFLLETDGNLFVNKNYINILSKRSIKKRIKRYSRLNYAALGKGESRWREFKLFLSNEKELMKRELKTNLFRLDDPLLKKVGEGLVIIYGGIPIDQNSEYLTLKRGDIEIKCYKNRVKKKIPEKAIDKAIVKKREILVGGCYFSKKNELIIRYIKPKHLDHFYLKLFQ